MFVQVGKAGSDTMAVAEALGRLVSLVLRLPSPLSARRRLEEVTSQLARIGGGQPTGFGAAQDPLAARRARPHAGRAHGRPIAKPRPRGGRRPEDALPPRRRPLPGVRPGHVRVRGGMQEVSLLRLQRVLSRMLKQAHLLRRRPSAARSTYREYASRAAFGAPPCIWTFLSILRPSERRLNRLRGVRCFLAATMRKCGAGSGTSSPPMPSARTSAWRPSSRQRARGKG